MTFLSELARLREAATKGPWFKRYCDDDNHMCMTVISGTDYGEVNTGQFRDEPDTIAATFHQIAPVVGDTADCNEATTDLILHLVNHSEAIEELVRAAEYIKQIGCIGGDGKPWCKGDHHSVYCPAGIAAKALEKLNRSE